MKGAHDYWIAIGIVFGILIISAILLFTIGDIFFCGETCNRGGLP